MLDRKKESKSGEKIQEGKLRPVTLLSETHVIHPWALIEYNKVIIIIKKEMSTYTSLKKKNLRSANWAYVCMYVPWQRAPDGRLGQPCKFEIKIVRTTILLASKWVLYEGTLWCIIKWISKWIVYPISLLVYITVIIIPIQLLSCLIWVLKPIYMVHNKMHHNCYCNNDWSSTHVRETERGKEKERGLIWLNPARNWMRKWFLYIIGWFLLNPTFSTAKKQDGHCRLSRISTNHIATFFFFFFLY